MGGADEVDLSSQVTYEYFVQNNDELMGFISVLQLKDVDRSANLEEIQCVSALPETVNLQVIIVV